MNQSIVHKATACIIIYFLKRKQMRELFFDYLWLFLSTLILATLTRVLFRDLTYCKNRRNGSPD
jgi:hypothetical protein